MIGYSFKNNEYIHFFTLMERNPRMLYKKVSKSYKNVYNSLSDLEINDATEIYVLDTDIYNIKKAIIEFKSFLLQDKIDFFYDLYLKYSKKQKIGYSPNFKYKDFTVALLFDDIKPLLKILVDYKTYLSKNNIDYNYCDLRKIIDFCNSFQNKYFYLKLKDKGDELKLSIVSSVYLDYQKDFNLEKLLNDFSKLANQEISNELFLNFSEIYKKNDFSFDFSVDLNNGKIENLYFGKRVIL